MNITVYHIRKSMSIRELWSADKLEELDTTIAQIRGFEASNILE